MTCSLCNILPKHTQFDGIPICESCYSQNIKGFIEFQDKRVPKKSLPIAIDEHVYIGDEDSARDIEVLQGLGITHILIAGSYMRAYLTNMNYKQLPLEDSLEQNLTNYLSDALAYIENAEGKILVHCAAGISRSGSIIVAYLMKKNNTGFDTALSMARNKSSRIRPNPNFERQLRDFNTQTSI
jgi:Dual specificity phosphatase, catalytic domain